MAAPLFFRIFFSRAAVIAGAAAMAVFALHREPDKLELLKNGVAIPAAISFCEKPLSISDAERMICLQDFQKLRQFADALAEALLSETFDTCASSETAGNVDKVWRCLSMKNGALTTEKYKRPF
jgi:hypothetical protein